MRKIERDRGRYCDMNLTSFPGVQKSKLWFLCEFMFVFFAWRFQKYLGNINHNTDYLYGFKWTSVI